MNAYEKDCQTQEANYAVLRKLTALLVERGWKLSKSYVANRGSVYAKFEQVGGEGCISGKVRIADHEEQSGSHASPEIEILCGEGWGEPDLVAAADAIVAGEQGQF